MKKIYLASLLLGAVLFAAAQDATIKPRLNHIAVYVMDLKVSTDFYSSVIGLDTIPEPFHDGRHTWFSVGPKSHLHVISGSAQKTEHDKNGHLCFSVGSVLDFINVLKKKGGKNSDSG